MQKMNNKKGVKLLATIMALAMVFVAGFALIGFASESDATTPVDADVPGVSNYVAGTTVIQDEGKYLISGTGNTPVAITISGMSTGVTFFVKSGTTVNITATSSTYTIIPVLSNVTITGSTGTVEKTKMASVYDVVTTSSSAATGSYKVMAVASTTPNANAVGSIETASTTVTGFVLSKKMATTSMYTYYSLGAIPSSISNDSSSEVEVNFATSTTAIDVVIDTTVNKITFSGLETTAVFKAVLATDGGIKLSTGDVDSASCFTNGMLTVNKGTVTTDTKAPKFVSTQVTGVSSADLSSAAKPASISADITLNSAGELTSSAYVYGVAIDDTEIIQVTGVSLVFGERSSFNGTIKALIGTSGTTDLGTSVGIEIPASTTAGRTVSITNTVGAQAVVCSGTSLKSSTNNIYGSEVILKSAVQTTNKSLTITTTTNADAIGLGNLQVGTVKALIITGYAVIPSGYTVTFDSNAASKIQVANLTVIGEVDGAQNVGTTYRISNVAGTGTATVVAPSSKIIGLTPYLHTGTSVTPATASVTTMADAVALANSGYDVTLTGTITMTEDAVFDAAKLTISGSLTVDTGKTLTLMNESQFKAGTSSSYLALASGSELIIKDSNILMEVTKHDLAEVKVTAKTSVYTNPTGPIAVGYMREATLDGDINGATADVYGKLIISSKTTLSSGSTMNVYKGGSLVVDGELTVEGKVYFKTGSVGEVNGTLNIGTTSGGAEVNANASNITVTENGIVKVSSINNKATKENKLVVTGSILPTYRDGVVFVDVANSIYAPAVFTVEGTLDVKGQIEADKVLDKGTVTINGKSVNTTIYLFDGVSVILGSVNGTVTVTDDKVNEDLARARVTVADGNSISLTDVTGVTISEKVTNSTYNKNSAGQVVNYKVYTTNMYISGTVGQIEKNTAGTISITATAPADANGYGKGKVEVEETLSLGKKIALRSAGPNVIVSGQIDCVAEDASITLTAGAMTVTGTVTVKTGTDFANELEGITYLNAAYYVISDNTNGTAVYTYTNMENAVSAVLTADDKTVFVNGKVTTTEETIEVPKDAIIEIDGELVVGKKTKMTAAVGSSISGDKITVKGTFVSMDYINDLEVDEVKADVISAADATKTWTGIVAALKGADEGTTIITNNAVEIDADTVIGKGVKVQSEYNITVKKNVVLTIDGTLEITKGTLTAENATAPDMIGKIIVGSTGSVAVVAASAGATENTVIKDVAGAHYIKLVGAKYYQFVSNVVTASQSIDEKLYGDIRLLGEITADTVTFTKDEKLPNNLTVYINDVGTASDEKKTVVNVDIELVGVKMVIAKNAVYNGEVTAAAADGKAVVAFDSVKGMEIDTHIDNSAATPVNSMLINSTYTTGNLDSEGKITIVSGIVTVGTVNAGNISAGKIETNADFMVDVASGATLLVPSAGEVKVGAGNNADESTVVVNGTLDVTKGKVTVTGILNIVGDAVVAQSGNEKGIIVNGTMNVIGTLSISEEDGKEGRVIDGGIITVGSKPTTLGAAGTVTGKMKLETNDDYVKVYAGTVGKIETASGTDALSSKVVINGKDYMTVYGASSLGLRSVIASEKIKLNGIDAFVNGSSGQDDGTKIFSDAGMMELISDDPDEAITLGNYDAVYFKLETSTADVYISVGTHLTLWIDGEKYTSNSSAPYRLAVGTHQVKILIDAGYQGNTTITFNGQVISNGEIKITTAMLNEKNSISAVGDLSVIPVETPTEKDDSGMGITDYLLIVLVILAAILVVVVAIRMMRS